MNIDTYYYSEFNEIDEEDLALAQEIRSKRAVIINKHRRQKKVLKSSIPKGKQKQGKTMADFKAHLESLGVDTSHMRQGSRGRSQSRTRELPRDSEGKVVKPVKRSRSTSRVAPRGGVETIPQHLQKQVQKDIRKKRLRLQRNARKGPGDRTILDMMPKHLFAGKRGKGKTDYR